MSIVPNTVPYPWPYDGHLDVERTAVVITGAQRNLADISATSDSVASVIESLCLVASSVGILTVAVTHARRRVGDGPPGRSVLPPPGKGDLLLDRLAASAPLVVVASGLDGFTGSSLEHELTVHGRTHLLLCGFASELTVDSTLRSANDRGFECLVLTDALASVDGDLADRALHSV
jgi:biuret amidohydrolase